MFWFVLSFLQNTASLNHTASFRLSGKIRQDDFESALQCICKRHEILRVRFFEQDGQPMQGLPESSAVRGEFRQIQDEREVDNAVNELETYCFDIANGETLKVILLSQSPVAHFSALCSHSLVVDGLSFRCFVRDLEEHYTKAYRENNTLQYLEYATK
jgi:hybrid polyketide synthase / nonribosomal peptide synthetase ACE1